MPGFSCRFLDFTAEWLCCCIFLASSATHQSPAGFESLYFGGIQECFAGAWVAKANGSQGTYPQLSATAENSNFSSVQGGCLCLFLWTALISLSNCRRRLPLLHSKEIVPKVMGKLNQLITHYFRPTQSNVCFNPLSNPLSVCLQGKGFPDCSENTHLGVWAHRGGRSVAGQALLGTPWLLSSELLRCSGRASVLAERAEVGISWALDKDFVRALLGGNLKDSSMCLQSAVLLLLVG